MATLVQRNNNIANLDKSYSQSYTHQGALGIYAGRFSDRNPDLIAAGKLTTTGDSAKLCMRPNENGIIRPESPEAVRRFRATVQPAAGQARVFYSKAYDPHRKWAAEMTHGLFTQPSFTAKELVNPHPNSLFQQRIVDKKESHYASHKSAPLGRSYDQRPGLPEKLDPRYVRFGIKTEKVGSAGEMLNPDKTYEEVDFEYDHRRDLYRRTHASYSPGEVKHRNYTAPNFNSKDLFGIPTPHFNDGRHMNRTLHWYTDMKAEKAAQIVSKRLDDFRERTQPQIGKVHDPIKDTLNVAPGHTFGVLLKPDEYGAGDLIHCRNAGSYLRGKDRIRGVLGAVRQHLKKANYHNFQDLLMAFKHYDKDGSGKIDINELREACAQFDLPLEPELLVQLMDVCDVNRDGFIDYVEFSNFLNWKDKMPSGLETGLPGEISTERAIGVVSTKDIQPKSPSSADCTPRRLQKQVDKVNCDMRTSSSMINAVVGGINTRDYRTYGVPTIRSDLPAPRTRRICDTKNYGDESNAFGLTNPSIYSNRGVSEKDLLIPRTKDQIRSIFTNIGVLMTGEDFERCYNTAQNRNPKGYVSVESFRNVLDELQASNLDRQ